MLLPLTFCWYKNIRQREQFEVANLWQHVLSLINIMIEICLCGNTKSATIEDVRRCRYFSNLWHPNSQFMCYFHCTARHTVYFMCLVVYYCLKIVFLFALFNSCITKFVQLHKQATEWDLLNYQKICLMCIALMALSIKNSYLKRDFILQIIHNYIVTQ